MELTNYLLELISTHELVSIPGLGGFISKEVSAHLDPTTHIFTPPHKQLAFNERLTDDGAKLLNFIKERESLTEVEALKEIENFVQSIKDSILEKGEYVLQDFGTFYRNNEGTLIFNASVGSEADPDNFGLPPILIKTQPITQSSKLLRKPKDRNAMSNIEMNNMPDPGLPGDDYSNSEENKKPVKEQSLLWLYIITPLVLIGGLGLFLGGTEDGRKVLANMHIISPAREKDTAFSQTAHEEAGTLETNDDSNKESFNNAASAEETIKKEGPETWGEETSKSKQEEIAKTEDAALATANIIHGKSGRFFIIAGGFAKKKNAVRLREKLVHEGLEAKILAPSIAGELYRVSLADYAELSAAVQKAEDFKSTYGTNIWVKKF